MSNRNRKTELLYFGHGYTGGTVPHRHPFFQLEYCIEGRLPATAAEQSFILDPGDYWLIPPETRHKFSRTGNVQNYISIKFVSSFGCAARVGHDPVCRYYLDRIRAVIDGETPFSAYSNEGKGIIEDYLFNFLEQLDRLDDAVPESQFETELQTCIYDLGAVANVDDLAENFGLSRSEFKYRFSREIGHGRIKQYIDSILLKMIEQHLRYSDVPLNMIAEQLRFSSIYAFSRYYKHHRGISPSQFRRRIQESGG